MNVSIKNRLSILILFVVACFCEVSSVSVFGQDDAVVATDNDKEVFFPGLKVTGRKKANGQGVELILALSIRKYPGETKHPYELLNSSLYSGQLELTASQLKQFQDLKSSIEYRAREYGSFTYDDLNLKGNKSPNISEFGEEIREYALDEIDQILLPHQKKLLENFEQREKVKKKSFVEVITTDPFLGDLELTKAQVANLKKKEEEFTQKYSTQLEKANAKFRTELVSVLSRDKRKQLEGLLGKEFFGGKTYQYERHENKDPIGIPFPVMKAGKLQVIPMKVVDQLLMFHPFRLLAQKEIQAELRIDKKQMEQFAELFASIEEKHRDFFESDETTHEAKSKLQVRIVRESPTAIAEILTDAQVQRVNQIYRQLVVEKIGFGRLLNLKSVVAALELTDDEIERLETKHYELERKRLLNLAEYELGFRKKVVEDLDAEQKEKLNEIFGQSFFGN